MKNEYDEFDRELDELEQELDESENNLDGFENVLNEFEDELDGFEDELDRFESEMGFEEPRIETFEFTDVNMRTAVLSKDDMIALLCLKTAVQGGAICRVDPREINPAVQLYDDPDKAVDWYTKSLVTSKENGWRIVYDGLPLEG